MKVAILGDTHFDISNGNERILEQQLMFFKGQFIPYLLDNGIDTIIQLGDFFDNRVKLSVNTQHRLKNAFFDVLEYHKINLYMLLGNHCINLKDSRKVHSMELFNALYDNVHLFENKGFLDLGNKKLLMVPWILPDEEFKPNNFPDADYIFGHFEMGGVEMVKGYNCESKELLLSDFKKTPVFSGHFHLRRYYSNVFYVGTPYQNDWSDYEELKGFHILDLETDDLDFIENKVSYKHLKVYLNNETKVVEIFGDGEVKQLTVDSKFDFSIFKNNKLKIFIEKDLQFTKKFIKSCEEVCLSYKVDLVNIEEEKVTEIKDIEFNVVDDLRERMDTEYKKNAFEEIFKEAVINLED